MWRVLRITALAVVLGLSSAVGLALIPSAQDAATVAEINRLASEVSALYEQGRYADAIAPAQRAVALAERAFGADDIRTGARHAWLGGVAQAAGRYDIAEPTYLRALDIAESVLGPDHPNTLTSVNNLAALYYATGRYADAEPLFVRALEGRERVLGPDHRDTLISVDNLAALYRATGRYAEAEPLRVRALEGFERVLGPDHPSTLVSVNNLAVLYETMGRYAEAEPLYVRALEGRERVSGPDHPNTLRSVHNLAELYRVTGRYAEAEPLFVRALATSAQNLGVEHIQTIVSIWSLYVNQYSLGSASISEESLALLPASLTALDARLDGQAVMPADLENPVSVASRASQALTAFTYARLTGLDAPDSDASAFRLMQRFRQSSAGAALAFAEELRRRGDPALAALVLERTQITDALDDLDRRLQALLEQPPGLRDRVGIDQINAQIAARQAELERVQDELEALDPEGRLLDPQRRPSQAADVQALLGGDEALIAYSAVGTDRRLMAYVVTREGLTTVPLVERGIVPPTEINPDAGFNAEQFRVWGVELRTGLDPAGAKTLDELPTYNVDLAAQMYADLIAPLEAAIGDRRHLIIVPDETLDAMPFQALVREASDAADPFDRYRQSEWLADRYAITMLPTVNTLSVLRNREAGGADRSPLLAFGDPDLPEAEITLPGGLEALGEQTVQTQGVQNYQPLGIELEDLLRVPQTGRLARAVAERLGASAEDVFLREDAAEATLRALNAEARLSNYQSVLFATHAVRTGEIEGVEEPALVLTPGDEAAGPLDDGLVLASEVVNELRFDADLMLLAACNTAASDDAAEGETLSGLARAFFFAGARSLMVSHWQADANATEHLVTAMVEAMAENPELGRADALRQAINGLRAGTLAGVNPDHDYAHPAFWAPFVVVGEGGAVAQAN